MKHRTILVVMPHPDDLELTCGASVAKWAGNGDRLVLVVATNGARGGKYASADAEEVRQVREAEQRGAAGLLGIAEVRFLDFIDGELEESEGLRRALVEQIRSVRPDMVVIIDPLTVIYRDSYVNHRDHRVLGMAMLDALYPQASNAGYFPDQLERGLQPHKVNELLLAKTDSANYWVDVDDTIDLRFEALHVHKSQMRLWPDQGEGIVAEQRAEAMVNAIGRGYRYAETFRRVIASPFN